MVHIQKTAYILCGILDYLVAIDTRFVVKLTKSQLTKLFSRLIVHIGNSTITDHLLRTSDQDRTKMAFLKLWWQTSLQCQQSITEEHSRKEVERESAQLVQSVRSRRLKVSLYRPPAMYIHVPNDLISSQTDCRLL